MHNPSLPPVEPPLAAVDPPVDTPQPPTKRKRRRWPWLLGGILILIAAGLIGGYVWYQQGMQPVNADDSARRVVTVESGMLPEQIANRLQESGVIRDAGVFMLYTQLQGVRSQLKAGSYRIAPSETLAEVVAHLTKGATDSFSIMFFPGATLFDPTDTPDAKRTDVYTMLRRAGYGDEEIRTALAAEYDHPLFADKPAGTNLEGYVFGDTYTFPVEATVEEVLTHTFDVYYEKIEQNDIIAGAKKRGLNLYEAITLASIIEREVSSDEDRRQVAQVFYDRLDKDISLGADATIVYAVDQANQPRTIDFQSPYNTRINPGLTPGPISSPSLSSLIAVADPAEGDYLYFVSGDDGTTHFARTEDEHISNTEKYCKILCREL